MGHRLTSASNGRLTRLARGLQQEPEQPARQAQGAAVADVRALEHSAMMNTRISEIQGLTLNDFKLISGGDLILYIEDWRLHIESAWRVVKPKGPLVGSLDFPVPSQSSEPVLNRLRNMIGRAITQVKVSYPVLDLSIELEGEMVLSSFCNTIDGCAWELRHKSGLRETAGDMVQIKQWQTEADDQAL